MLVGGESDDVEDWKRWDLLRLAGGGLVGRVAAAGAVDSEGDTGGDEVSERGELVSPSGVVTGESEEEWVEAEVSRRRGCLAMGFLTAICFCLIMSKQENNAGIGKENQAEKGTGASGSAGR